MKYKQKTRRLGIPVVGYNDVIRPEMELKKYQIIESMLLAGLRGAVNAVFEEGDATIRKREDGSFSVLMSATGARPSCTGSVGGAYFEAPSSVSWEGLEEGRSYFLYLRGSQKTFEDPADVRTIAAERRLQDSVSVLIARVDLGGDKPSLDRYPDGKVNARDLAAHVVDSENPHGESMVQDRLVVKKRISIDPLAVFEIGSVNMEAGVLVEMMSKNRSAVLDFKTGGGEGVVLDAGGKVSFVSVSRLATGKLTKALVGEVAVGYFGKDSKAATEGQFVVRNSGDVGVDMRALVVLG